LLEEALDGLPDAEAALRIRVMGLLARDRLHTGVVDESRALVLRAIGMARDLGDPAALATSLAGKMDFPWQPHETEQMLADGYEMAEMAERANDLENVARAHFRCVSYLLELGDMPGAVAAAERMSRFTARLRQQIFTLFELGVKATILQMRGTLDEAERLIIQIARIKLPHQTHVTDAISMLIFSLRREQSRLRELAPMVAMFVRQNNDAATWRPGLALLYVELGDLDAARAVFTSLAADDFASLPRDGRWTTCITYLAEVCVALGDQSRASVLYHLLRPWQGRNIVMGGGAGCWGSSDRFLGLLATVEGRWTDAERHFVEALAMNQRMGALAPLAHTQCDFAEMVLKRAYPGDMARASTLLREAGEHAATLGLAAVAARVAASRQRLADPAPKTPVPDNLTVLAPKPPVPDNLTVRELEVLRLMAIGRGNAEIALVLEIGQSTVATHVHNILVKTGCANRTEAAAYAVRQGLQTH
jgi:DNA-binding NarL/FixJ family response regulator